MKAINSLMMAILECDYDDVGILEYVQYDLKDIVNDMIDNGIKPTLNNITNEIFIMGQLDVVKAVTSEIKKIEDELEDGGKEHENLEEKLNALRILNPKVDISWNCNCLDTDCWFTKNEEIYRKYFNNRISEIEEKMGFEFV